MSFEYFIPGELSESEFGKPFHMQQLLTEYGNTPPGLMVNQQPISEKVDNIQRAHTPAGVGGFVIYIYNFTSKPIFMLDGNNGLNVLEPQGLDRNANNDSIVVDIIYNNQDFPVGKSVGDFMMARRLALTGLNPGIAATNCYADDVTVEGSDRPSKTFIDKASSNQRFRFTIHKVEELFRKYNSAFYFPEGNIVIGTIYCGNKVAIHPRSESSFLLKARPKSKEFTSLGIDVAVNDPEYHYEKLFMNVSGKVMEIPITRNVEQAAAVQMWDNVHERESTPVTYDLGDKNIPIRLFGSRSEAESGGSPDKLIERQMIADKLQLQQDKLQQDMVEFERSKEREEKAQQIFREKMIHDSIEREKEFERRRTIEQNNERVENVSFMRKSLLEGVKAIAAVAAAATMFFGWYIKKKASA